MSLRQPLRALRLPAQSLYPRCVLATKPFPCEGESVAFLIHRQQDDHAENACTPIRCFPAMTQLIAVAVNGETAKAYACKSGSQNPSELEKNPSGNEDIIPAPTKKRMQCYRAIALSWQPPSECSGARLAIRSGAPQLQSTAL